VCQYTSKAVHAQTSQALYYYFGLTHLHLGKSVVRERSLCTPLLRYSLSTHRTH